LTMPLPRYFSMPSRVVGAVLVSISARNCWPNSPVPNPPALRVNPLAGADRGQRADDRHQVAVPLGFHLEHGEVRVLVVERDALNQPGEAFDN